MNFDIFKALNHAQSIIGEDVSIEVCSKPYGGRGSVEVRIIDRASVPSRAATFVIQKHELELLKASHHNFHCSHRVCQRESL